MRPKRIKSQQILPMHHLLPPKKMVRNLNTKMKRKEVDHEVVVIIAEVIVEAIEMNRDLQIAVKVHKEQLLLKDVLCMNDCP